MSLNYNYRFRAIYTVPNKKLSIRQHVSHFDDFSQWRYPFLKMYICSYVGDKFGRQLKFLCHFVSRQGCQWHIASTNSITLHLANETEPV